MGCVNSSNVITLENEEEYIQKLIKEKKEILFLTYETKSDDEDILLIGNDKDMDDKYNLPFFDGVQIKFDLYDNNIKITGPQHTFAKKGMHKIKMIIKEQIYNFSYMFYNCVKLKSIKGYINTSKAKDFSWMFSNCTSLEDISALKNIDVSDGEKFQYMFNECTSLKDISSIKDWNVNKGKDFSGMFKNCKSLKNIDLKSWNIQKNGVEVDGMFEGCESNIFNDNANIFGINPNENNN